MSTTAIRKALNPNATPAENDAAREELEALEDACQDIAAFGVIRAATSDREERKAVGRAAALLATFAHDWTTR